MIHTVLQISSNNYYKRRLMLTQIEGKKEEAKIKQISLRFFLVKQTTVLKRSVNYSKLAKDFSSLVKWLAVSQKVNKIDEEKKMKWNERREEPTRKQKRGDGALWDCWRGRGRGLSSLEITKTFQFQRTVETENIICLDFWDFKAFTPIISNFFSKL